MTAVIIEDESLIARELMHKLQQITPAIEVLTHCDSLASAKEWLQTHKQPDMFFMDIQLGDGVSFELFESHDIKAPVIFTTAYDDYALQAFKSNGVDYLLKPIDNTELQRAVEKCRVIVESRAAYPHDIKALLQVLSGHEPARKYKEKFVVNFRRQWIPVDTRDIAVFMRENLNYLIKFDGEKHILDFTTLEEIEQLLDPNLYYRVNRQTIIHIDIIKSVKPLDNATLTVTLKDPIKMEVTVGRAKAPEFKKWFDR